MRPSTARRVATALLLAGAAWSVASVTVLASAAQDPEKRLPAQQTILFSDVEGEIITPVIADFLTEGVARAQREGRAAYLIELDTPGGLDTSMRQIVQTLLETTVPVIVYVPAGGRAASAGAIIGMSATVLAMAPASSIGAATPVDLQGATSAPR